MQINILTSKKRVRWTDFTYGENQMANILKSEVDAGLGKTLFVAGGYDII